MRRTARAIIVKDNYLYVVRRITKKWGMYFSIPGGKIENGETPREAVIREVKEELNLDVEIIDLFGEYNEKEFGNYHYIFLCKIIGGILGKGRGEEYDWIDPDNIYIPDKITLKEAKEALFLPRSCEKDLKEYLERIEKNDKTTSH